MAADHRTTPPAAPNRRALLSTAGAAALLAPAAPAAMQDGSATGPDAELIRLSAEWLRVHGRLVAPIEVLFDMHERDWSDEQHDEKEELEDAEKALRERIFGLKAATVAGLKAKARVVDRWFPTPFDDPERLANPDDWPAASLVNDVLALAEGAA